MEQVRHLVEVFFDLLLLLLLLYFVVVVVLLIIFFLLVCFPFYLLLTNYSFARFCDKHNPSNSGALAREARLRSTMGK